MNNSSSSDLEHTDNAVVIMDTKKLGSKAVEIKQELFEYEDLSSLWDAARSGGFQMVLPSSIAIADLEHHTRFIGPSSVKDDQSPVSMVKRGLLPLSYLERFGHDSSYRQEIDAYKVEIAGKTSNLEGV